MTEVAYLHTMCNVINPLSRDAYMRRQRRRRRRRRRQRRRLRRRMQQAGGALFTVRRRLKTMGHALQIAMQIVESWTLGRFSAPALVHEVVELAAATWWRCSWYTCSSAAAAPLTGIHYYLQNVQIA